MDDLADGESHEPISVLLDQIATVQMNIPPLRKSRTKSPRKSKRRTRSPRKKSELLTPQGLFLPSLATAESLLSIIPSDLHPKIHSYWTFLMAQVKPPLKASYKFLYTFDGPDHDDLPPRTSYPGGGAEADRLSGLPARCSMTFDWEDHLCIAVSCVERDDPDGEQVGKILMFQYDGTFLRTIGQEILEDPCLIAINHQGNLIVGEGTYGSWTFVILDSRGTLIQKIGPRQGDEPLGVMAAVCVDPNSKNIVAADTLGKIYVFAPDGTLLVNFNSPVLKLPSSIAVLENSEIVISDYKSHNIQFYSQDFTEVFRAHGKRGTAPGEFRGPNGFALTKDNNLIVTDAKNGRIQVLSIEGKFLMTFGEPDSPSFTQEKFHADDGKFFAPKCPLIDRHGNIWICDGANMGIRIQIFG